MFSGFDPITAGWFGARFGRATVPQERGWPAIAAGNDTLIAAPTGSGKTLAAFLYCLDDLLGRARARTLADRTYVVYVSPLRALSNDIQANLAEPLAALAAAFGVAPDAIRTAVRTGDTPASERQKHARVPPHVLVTTPESLYILLTTQKGREALSGARTVIVDEIHAMADDRRGAHLALSLERLDALAAGARPQRIGLSATQRPIQLVADFLTGGKPCTIIDEGHFRQIDLAICAPDGELAAVASHEQWGEIHDRIAALSRAHRTTLVFANTRRLCERVAHALSQRLGEASVGAHHGAMARKARQEVEQKLKTAEMRVVVATASLELGIDVGAVELVCQLGSPRCIATLLQRIGRAGHALGLVPKGRLFALTRDDLVDCAALARAVRAGRLDALSVPDKPLDVLAQQLVAATVGHDWDEDALFQLARRAYPYRDLGRDEFEAVLDMLAEGFATRRGRSGAYLHRDRVNRRVRARRHARLAAIMSGGAIPERADYDVVADPEGIKVGTLDEDFAIESMAGDVFLLGNTSWRIKRVETQRVRVEDARGMAPTIPFWLGEAPSRTPELSEEVSRLREEVEERLEDPAAAARFLEEACALDGGLARQIVDYLAATRRALGCVPSQRTLVVERFFDEGGGMQLVLHAPFGARLNRAWGLALRKRFCRTFDFELQAAATDDGIVLSLGPQHSFPLETVFAFVRAEAARELLTQAALQAPVFGTRWRWNATRALAILRMRHGKRIPAYLQRMRSDDLLAAVFPAHAGCQDNHPGEAIAAPAHPLVDQTMRDCLEEWMDAPALEALLRRMEAGELTLVARDVPEPSPLSHAILNANPYAYLDDAPLEERRTRAVSVRRGLPADVARDLGALDAAAIAEVRRDAWPLCRDPDELHDALCLLGILPDAELDETTRPFARELAGARRAARLGRAWVAAERLPLARLIWPSAVLDPPLAAAPGAPVPEDREAAVTAIVRGRLECTGPATEAQLLFALDLTEAEVAAACARLEGDGNILRGHFTPGVTALEWCDRRLLARIHRLTLGRLRREIEPVTPADFGRFLERWQHLAPGTQLHGVHGVAEVIEQLAGLEAPLGAWETEVLPARISGYAPALLDELCLAGEVVWGRRSASTAERTTRATPLALWPRTATPFMLAVRPPRAAAAAGPEAATEVVASLLASRGALFYAEILEATGLVRRELDDALWALVATGRVTADGFAALRTLADESPRRTGRWSLLAAPEPAGEVAEVFARQLLRRYGIVHRELCRKELLPPWRDLLLVYRRLEARGEIRGGRFVAGVVGEQFARADAVDALRLVRRLARPQATEPPTTCASTT